MVVIVTQVNGAEVLDGGGKPLSRRQVKTLGCDGDGKKSDVVVHVQQKGTKCGAIAWGNRREQQREITSLTWTTGAQPNFALATATAGSRGDNKVERAARRTKNGFQKTRACDIGLALRGIVVGTRQEHNARG